MFWSRGPRARAAGGSLHTGVILKTLSTGDVSGSLPIGGHAQLQGGSSSISSSDLFHKLEVTPIIPKIRIARQFSVADQHPVQQFTHLVHPNRSRDAPSTGASYNTGAFPQPSRPVPRPVVLDVLALLLVP